MSAIRPPGPVVPRLPGEVIGCRVRSRSAWILAVLVTIASVGCSGGSDPDAISAPSTTRRLADTVDSSSAPTTTVPTTSTAVEPSSTVPVVEGTVELALDDFESILEELSRRKVALYAAPNLDSIAQVCSPDSECADQYSAQLTDAISKGYRTVGGLPVDVLSFEVLGFDGTSLEESSAVTIDYVVAPLPEEQGQVVDAAGAVVFTLVSPGEGPQRARVVLVRSDDGALPWRIATEQSLGPAE